MMRSAFSRQLRRLPFVPDLIDASHNLFFPLSRDRELRRLGYTLVEDQFVVASSAIKIDIVIPSIDKDVDTLPHVIESVRRNVMHPLGSIYVISPESEKIRQICSAYGCQNILEDTLLPINKSNIDYNIGGITRSGWLFQQFLKLSGDLFCEQDNYLVIDSDTLLIKPQVFEFRGKFVMNYSNEYHLPYFDIYERLFGFRTPCPVSFTSHHILVNISILRQLKDDLLKKNGLIWYEAIINSLDTSELSGHSDYDTYGHYALGMMKERFCLHYWHNKSLSRELLPKVTELSARYSNNYKSLSFHSYNQSVPPLL